MNHTPSGLIGSGARPQNTAAIRWSRFRHDTLTAKTAGRLRFKRAAKCLSTNATRCLAALEAHARTSSRDAGGQGIDHEGVTQAAVGSKGCRDKSLCGRHFQHHGNVTPRLVLTGRAPPSSFATNLDGDTCSSPKIVPRQKTMPPVKVPAARSPPVGNQTGHLAKVASPPGMRLHKHRTPVASGIRHSYGTRLRITAASLLSGSPARH